MALNVIPQAALPNDSEAQHVQVGRILADIEPDEEEAFLPYNTLVAIQYRLHSEVAWLSESCEYEVLATLQDAISCLFSPTPLWYIHGDAYDLSGFLHEHPGGAAWLRLSAGRDVTELFESHHLRIRKATRRLNAFKARRDGSRTDDTGCCGVGGPVLVPPPVARCPRKWNWDGKGFYATLRDRAAAALLGLSADEGGGRSDGEKKREGAATA